MTAIHYVDTNLLHDLVTGRSVTAILHIVNGTPIDWYSKQEATVETASYGLKFVAGRIAVDQIVDLRYTLMYLGVPIRSKSFMFGDKKSVIQPPPFPTLLSRRHHISACHRVREAIALKYLRFIWKYGKTNPADILSKHWEFPSLSTNQATLFWRGETAEIKQQPKGSARNHTVCLSSEPQENQKDSRLATASSQYLPRAHTKQQNAP